uniref:Small integral membrane protein 1 n=1 Tax=Takifugu rubripes TaxID=31033 RepID=A0A3B5K7S1_TAKRU
MESNNPGSVHYNRWNEDNINIDVEGSIYNRTCTGTVGIVVKSAGALCALVGIYLIGYVTGYYVHRC